MLPEATLTSHERSNIGRVLREAISNALTHARPMKINIIIDIKGEYLSLIIADDGTGSEPKRWVGHTGLDSMKTRVTEMGGEISWRYEKTQGTSVEVLIPLRRIDDESPESLQKVT